MRPDRRLGMRRPVNAFDRARKGRRERNRRGTGWGQPSGGGRQEAVSRGKDPAGAFMLEAGEGLFIGQQQDPPDLARARREAGSSSIRGLLARRMPRSVADILTEQSSCIEAKAANLSAESQRALIARLISSHLTLSGAGPMEKAMAMRGGVSLKEVDPATMSSRLVRGLHFAGEILDLTGPCGGYNIQWAFSSGFLAGSSAAAALQNNQNKENSSND